MAGQIGALRVTLGANTANFEQGMRRAARTARVTGQDIERSYLRVTQSGVRAFSTLRIGATALGAALAGNALAGYTRNTLEWASSLSEAAQQIGVTVEQLQIMRLQAEQNGASVQGMERAVGILNRTLGQAQGGSRSAMAAFTAIPGITKEMVNGFRNVGEAIPVVNEHISRLSNGMQQAAAAQALYGRGARELLPVIAQGAAGWDRATQAAIRNGMVTAEQARKADEAADALGELAAALRVQLLGAIVDALPGLIEVVRVLGQIIGFAIRAVGWIGRVVGALVRPRPIVSATGAVVGAINDARMARDQSGAFGGALLSAGLRMPPPGTNLNLDQGRSGGGNQRDDSARRQFQYEQELRDLRLENLRALKENTENIDEQNELQEQIVSLENEKRVAEVSFRQAQNEINDTQAAELMRRRGIVNETERIGRVLEHTRRGQEAEARIAELQAEEQQATLRAHADLAETAAERRRIELELLDITYRARRTALEELIKQRPGTQEAREAQVSLNDLAGRQNLERRSIFRNTRGPLESFLAELPLTAARAQEALESLAVNGLQAVTDGILDVITGARSMGDVFRNVVRQIIADLLRIQLQRSIIGPLANALGGLFGGGVPGSNAGVQGLLTSIPGRAAGGPVLPGRTYVVGERGPELLQMGGTGGHVFANDNIGGAPGGRVVVELRSELLDARIAEGSGIVLARAYPGMKADIKGSIADGNRRRA